MTQLPIDKVIPVLQEHLKNGSSAILLAEPGAGKTTRTPLQLLQEPWLAGQSILLLEPRRLAARSAAIYMAKQLGESVGEMVGYRIRSESRVSSRTRITVVTEGILTRMLQNDPALIGVGLVIFDEFHERSIHADLGLALALQSQQVLREDLRILIMSATLDPKPIAQLLGTSAVVQSQGRNYPVETRYSGSGLREPIEVTVERVIMSALNVHQGSLLVFLPGAKEIRRVERRLAGNVPSDVILAPLFGALSQVEQQRAIEAAPSGKRKVVLATSIAESSLTVDGVTVVIDSGLRRTSLFSPRTGMNRLVTTRAARDSADQRRGRAGRTAPGVCYRLWSESEDRALEERTPPEMLEADLTQLALEVAAWGAASPEELVWLDAPPVAPYGQAVQLLRQLGALDDQHRITEHGIKMNELGLHPRLAHMLLRAETLGLGRVACSLAALLEERDLFKGQVAGRDCDMVSRLSMLMEHNGSMTSPNSSLASSYDVDPIELRRILELSCQWEKVLSFGKSTNGTEQDWQRYCGLLISFAYPDRIARRRPDGRFLLRNGRGAVFTYQQPLGTEEYLAIAEVDDQGSESVILRAASLGESDLNTFYREDLHEEKIVQWDEEAQKVKVRRRLSLGAIVLKDVPDPNPSQEDITRALLQAVTMQGVTILPWNGKSRQLQARIGFMHKLDERWPDVSDEALSTKPEQWLAPYISNFRKPSDMKSLSLYSILENWLGWERTQQLNTEAPTHLLVPSGSKVLIHYDGPQAPYVAVRLQEVFGMMDTPRIGYGQVKITMHLLSPASRPVQVTSDLHSFWKNTYFEVKKDLKGRYPKHYWPEDPLQATATRKVRPEQTKK
ncbi:ATP-dependent helicase HrpB [Paenibacillus segetis]|uniref:ATP-dependent helicase HrpB n=1 Tax=Paenibacillus segetis TaxID=1325360 RepID=A0ABQ1YC00_9BACL|nr:ATP-dependent helicase HrpB [Paenibacillus segetis]GGH19121.1 ATP-dependent helicase HrpB [Paenibacillus segetis]